MKFKDREEAGIMLAKKIIESNIKNACIVALPRGGVPIALPVAKALNTNLKLLMIRKVGLPGNSEFAIGAVSLTDQIINSQYYINPLVLKNTIDQERKRIEEMTRLFNHELKTIDIKKKTIVLVDDGIATGNCMLLAIKELRKNKPKKIIVAVPVCEKHTLARIKQEVDEVISLTIPDSFHSIGAFYENFRQINDNEIIMNFKKY